MGKQVNQGQGGKYGGIDLTIPGQNKGEPLKIPPSMPQQEEEIEFGREIFNLNKQLIAAVNDFIAQEANAGVKLWDEKAGKEKKINKSLWVRDVLTKALEDAGYVPSPKPERKRG